MASPLLPFCFLITLALTGGKPAGGNLQNTTGQSEGQFQGPTTSDARDEAKQARFGGLGDIMHPEGLNNAPTPDWLTTKDESKRWPGYPGGCTVPYVLSKGLIQGNHSQVIEAAMKYISDKVPCIKFKKRSGEEDYIYITDDTNMCGSSPGRWGGRQKLYLGRSCLYNGMIIHELIHALGGFHEHQRSDRDDYLIVHEWNIEGGSELNFEKIPPEKDLSFAKFDYNSIMMYGSTDFSVGRGIHTMDRKDGEPLPETFDKIEMTAGDQALLKGLYKCE